jgi:anti-anti-sigma regulatory factor
MSDNSSSVSAQQAASDEAWKLGGALTLYTVETVYRECMGRLSTVPDLTLDLSGVDSCDCAGLQFLCAAKKGLSTAPGKVRVENLSEAITAAAEGIGLPLSEITHSPTIV